MINRKRTAPTALAALASAALLVLSGCGSSTPSASSTSPASTPSPTSTSYPAGPAATRAAITKAYVQFFSGQTSASEKVALVQHGDGFAKVIEKQAGSPISKGTSVKVLAVTLNGARAATVRYTILLGGKAALSGQTGTAVLDKGTWKVGADTFCSLLRLEQSAPPLCPKVG